MTNNIKCWYCGALTMEPKGNYFQCSECGATWNKLPALGEFIDIERRRGGM